MGFASFMATSKKRKMNVSIENNDLLLIAVKKKDVTMCNREGLKFDDEARKRKDSSLIIDWLSRRKHEREQASRSQRRAACRKDGNRVR